MMDIRNSLVQMLRQLLKDMEIVTSQGSGYYTCIPFAQRFNKLLGQAKLLFAGQPGIVDTFDEAPLSDPNDPADKMKVLLGIRIETNQLIVLLESTNEEPAQ